MKYKKPVFSLKQSLPYNLWVEEKRKKKTILFGTRTISNKKKSNIDIYIIIPLFIKTLNL